MSIPKNITAENPGLDCYQWAIVTAYRGSIAHGTYVPNTDPNSIDDKDVMAFCVPPPDYSVGLRQFHSRGTQEVKSGEWDVVVYELRKAVHLLLKGNPNVLSMLWLPKKLIIDSQPAWRVLVENRQAFVGKHVYRAYTGYAVSQLRKMKGGEYKGYMGDKRRVLVEKFGYDTKNASHLIRLLRQGIEFLNDGELYVERHDASELVAIKRGEWSLEKVKETADKLFTRAEEAYDRSALPTGPDHELANELVINATEHAWRQQGIGWVTGA